MADPGEGPGEAAAPLFSEETEAPRTEKQFMETGPG